MAERRRTKSDYWLARRHSPEWQLLRSDVPTFITSAATYVATLCIAVAAIGLIDPDPTPFPQGRLLFWVLMLPLTIWALALRDYGPRSVAVLRVLMVADSPIALALLALAYATGADSLHLFVIVAIGAIVLSAIAAWYYRRSVLRRQGPFRG